MTTILLARHAESDWNAAGRWQGHADRPLTELGRTQAEALARELAGVPLAALYASDLRRARDTARVVAEHAGGVVLARRDLREVDVGSWTGLTRAEVEERYPEGVRRWERGEKGWEGGECYEEMADRVVAAIHELAAEHPGERILVVSHGGSVRAVHARARGMDFHSYRLAVPVEPNARVSAVVVENGGLRVAE